MIIKEAEYEDEFEYEYSDGFVEDSEYENTIDDNGVLYTNEKIIKNGEYDGADDIIKIVAPNCIKIEDSALKDCKNLKSIELPNCREIGSFALRFCDSLQNIDCPNVQEIGDYAFEDCINLTNIDLPNCTEIGEYAFNKCENLRDIDTPDSVKIGTNTFENTPLEDEYSDTESISKVDKNGTLYTEEKIIDREEYEGREDIKKVIAPNCEEIGDEAFCDCYRLNNIGLPDDVKIEKDAFENTPLEDEEDEF